MLSIAGLWRVFSSQGQQVDHVGVSAFKQGLNTMKLAQKGALPVEALQPMQSISVCEKARGYMPKAASSVDTVFQRGIEWMKLAQNNSMPVEAVQQMQDMDVYENARTYMPGAEVDTTYFTNFKNWLNSEPSKGDLLAVEIVAKARNGTLVTPAEEMIKHVVENHGQCDPLEWLKGTDLPVANFYQEALVTTLLFAAGVFASKALWKRYDSHQEQILPVTPKEVVEQPSSSSDIKQHQLAQLGKLHELISASPKLQEAVITHVYTNLVLQGNDGCDQVENNDTCNSR